MTTTTDAEKVEAVDLTLSPGQVRYVRRMLYGHARLVSMIPLEEEASFAFNLARLLEAQAGAQGVQLG